MFDYRISPMLLALELNRPTTDEQGVVVGKEYWNFAESKWTATPDPKKTLSAYKKESANQADPDYKMNSVGLPFAALASPYVYGRIYSLEADGRKAELLEVLPRPSLLKCAGIY